MGNHFHRSFTPQSTCHNVVEGKSEDGEDGRLAHRVHAPADRHLKLLLHRLDLQKAHPRAQVPLGHLLVDLPYQLAKVVRHGVARHADHHQAGQGKGPQAKDRGQVVPEDKSIIFLKVPKN